MIELDKRKRALNEGQYTGALILDLVNIYRD